MSADDLRRYAFAWHRVREVISNRSFRLSTRIALAYAWLSRRRRSGAVPVPLLGETIWLDRASLASDWETMREIFLPRKQAYSTDYADATVLDLGAHKGFFGVYALGRGASAVISYEPETTNFRFLDRTAANARRHGKRWDVHQAAVARSTGRRTLHLSDEAWRHSLVETAGGAKADVNAVAVGELLEAARAATDGRLIAKVDVEGAELEIFPGETRWSLVDEVFCETHGESARIAVSEALAAAHMHQVGERGGVLHWRRAPAPPVT